MLKGFVVQSIPESLLSVSEDCAFDPIHIVWFFKYLTLSQKILKTEKAGQVQISNFLPTHQEKEQYHRHIVKDTVFLYQF